MQKDIDNFISDLVSGSIVVVANDEESFEKFQILNHNKVEFFHVTNEELSPLNHIMEKLFGKVIDCSI